MSLKKYIINTELITKRKVPLNEVLEGYERLKKHPDSKFLNAGLLAVIDPLSDASEVYNFFKSLSAPSVDFLYKDGNHTKLPLNKSSVFSTEYGRMDDSFIKRYMSVTQIRFR